MTTEHEIADNGGPNAINAVTAITELLETVFGTTLLPSALSQIRLTMGHQIKSFKAQNLSRLNHELKNILTDRNLSKSDLKHLSLSTGFLLLEKASYQDDKNFQRNWANLLVSSLTNMTRETYGFSIDQTYVEILHQLSPLDLAVLRHITEYGCKGSRHITESLSLVPIDPLELHDAFPGQPAHLSLEKLVALGCAYRVLRNPISTDEGDGYGPLCQDIVVTLIGLNLHISVSGEEPEWLQQDSHDAGP